MYLERLQDDYERLLETDEEYDVIVYAGEKESVKEFHALSNILRIRSQYLRNELTKGKVEKKDGKFILKIPNISPHIFKTILRFIYCGKIDFTKLEGPELLKLLIAADLLNLQSLAPRIEEYLLDDHHEFLQKNSIELLEIVYQHESFAKLFNFYVEKICEDPETFINSEKFISIKAPLLELLLKRDDLFLEEIDIWNSLIRWGFAQNPTIPKDVTKWSKEVTTIMDRTLHRYIPLIRFQYISSEDFLERVFPFKKLLSKELFNTTLAFYLAPNKKSNIDIQLPRQSKCDSIIVKSRHFSMFSSWIDKKNESHYKIKNMPYDFKLIYRATKDDMSQAAFHQNCDNKGATVVIVKINDSEQIVGGYNPFVWDLTSGWRRTYDSFIFLFKNGMDLKTAKVGYCNNDQWSIGNYPGYGPSFGNDLRYNIDGTWISSQLSYSKIYGIPATFNVDVYEVFQVIKK